MAKKQQEDMSDYSEEYEMLLEMEKNRVGLFGVFAEQMKLYLKKLRFLVPVLLLVVIFLSGAAVKALSSTKLGDYISFTGESYPVMLLSLMPVMVLFICGWFTSKTIYGKDRKVTARPVNDVLGRTLAALIFTEIIVIAAYFIASVVTKANNEIIGDGFKNSAITAAAFTFAFTCMGMFINTFKKKVTSLMIFLVAFVVPIVYMALMFLEKSTLDTLQYIFPVTDEILSVAGTGFGGFSLFTVLSLIGAALSMVSGTGLMGGDNKLINDLLSFIQNTPAFSISYESAIMVAVVWGLLFLGLATLFAGKRKVEE